MMGGHHAACGAAAWVAVTSTAPYTLGIYPVSDVGVITGAIVCAGAALLPDADHHSGTIANSLPRSPRGGEGRRDHLGRSPPRYALDPRDRGLHRARLARGTRDGRVGHVRDRGGRGGRRRDPARRFRAQGPQAHARRQARAMDRVGDPRRPHRDARPEEWNWLPVAVGLGVTVHIIGDILTTGGCPLLWPITFKAPRWVRRTNVLNDIWRPGGNFALPILGNAGSVREWLLLIPISAYAVVGVVWSLLTQMGFDTSGTYTLLVSAFGG
ncbi:metal-dependent hydrolase [Oerskovia sp. M15]